MSSHDPVFDTRFEARFLHPRYWLSWLALGVLMLLAFVPVRLRDRLAAALAPLVFRISKSRSISPEPTWHSVFRKRARPNAMPS